MIDGNFIQECIRVGLKGLARVSCTAWGNTKLWTSARAIWSKVALHIIAALASFRWMLMDG